MMFDKNKMKQFRLTDITLFKKYKKENLQHLEWKETDKDIMEVDRSILRLVNKKLGTKLSAPTMKQMGNHA